MRAALIASCVLALSAGDIATAQRPPLTLEVAVKARAMRSGEVILLTIRPSRAVTSIDGSAFDRSLAPFRTANGEEWQALVGVPLTAKPARYDATLRAKTAEGESIAAHVALPIERGVFATRRLTVDPQFVNPPASAIERIQSEAKAMADLFAHPSPERLWRGPFVVPVPGASTSAFGRLSILNGESRSRHQGADFRAAEGTDVHAPNGGRVVIVADYYFSGNTVIIDHGAGVFSLFAHFSKVRVEPGATVKTGDVLGAAGATGRVTGPHVHWAVRLNGASIDPLSLVDASAAIVN